MVTPPRCIHIHRQPQQHLLNKQPHKPLVVSTPTCKHITHINHGWPNTKVRAHTSIIGYEKAGQLGTKAQLWKNYGKPNPHTMYAYHPYYTRLTKWHPNQITWWHHLSPTSLHNHRTLEQRTSTSQTRFSYVTKWTFNEELKHKLSNHF